MTDAAVPRYVPVKTGSNPDIYQIYEVESVLPNGNWFAKNVRRNYLYTSRAACEAAIKEMPK